MLTLEEVWTPAAQQMLFRRMLDAAARPGRVMTLADAAPGAGALLAAVATLVDHATPLACLDPVLDAAALRFLDAPAAAPDTAPFLVADGARPPPEDLAPQRGTLDAPEDGATLFLAVAALGRGDRLLRLAGPGIPQERRLLLAGLHPAWLARRAVWCARFPLGVDLVLADTDAVAVLPRTTRIVEEGGTP